MRAVILAGGDTPHLHPLTLDTPAPMLPLLGRPIMEHTILLLKKYGVTHICISVTHRPQVIMGYFGDGDALGITLTYAVESTSLGTAGDVKRCMAHLGGEDFLVVPGDALCDLDLSFAMEAHRTRGGAATLVLRPHPVSGSGGRVLLDENSRVSRLIPSPCLEQVSTTLVSTGIYILTPAALDALPTDSLYDFTTQLLPDLLAADVPLYGCVCEGYWRELANCGDFLRCATDALSGRLKVDMNLPLEEGGVWSATPLPPDVTLIPPCWIGAGVTLSPHCLIGPHAVIGGGCTVGTRTLIQHSILLPGVEIGGQATTYGSILCDGAQVQRGAVLNEGTVVGSGAMVGAQTTLLDNVKLWPRRIAPAGHRLHHSITDAAGGDLCFGDSGVMAGYFGQEITPQRLLTLGGLLGEFAQVGLGHWGGTGAALLFQAATCGIMAAGGHVLQHKMECPSQASWLAGELHLPISLFIHQENSHVTLHFFQVDGLSLSPATQQKLERRLRTGDGCHIDPRQLGDVVTTSLLPSHYAQRLARRCILPHMDQRPLTVAVVGDSPANWGMSQLLLALGCAVTTTWQPGIPAFSDSGDGFHLTAQDEMGTVVDGGQLLGLITLIEMEQGSGTVAVSPQTTAAVELIAAGFGGTALRLGHDEPQATRQYARLPWLRDSAAAAGRICTRLMCTEDSLCGLLEKTPRLSSKAAQVPLHTCPHRMVQAILARHGTANWVGNGIRLSRGGGWVHLMFPPHRQVVNILAESRDMEIAAELCHQFIVDTAQLDLLCSEQDSQGGGSK